MKTHERKKPPCSSPSPWPPASWPAAAAPPTRRRTPPPQRPPPPPPAQDTQTAESNVDKALALINTFATGDTETAAQLLDENYIQHNLAYGTGEDAFLASVEGLAAADAETTVENIRAFEDGDYVFLQNVYNFAGAGEQVAFDIFRFDEDGEIAEHWDNPGRPGH